MAYSFSGRKITWAFELICMLVLISALSLPSSYSAEISSKAFLIKRCPSGRPVKIIDITKAKIEGTTKVALILRYQSAFSNQQINEIIAEADDIWDQFLGDVEQAHVDEAIICAFYNAGIPQASKPTSKPASKPASNFISFNMRRDVHSKWSCQSEPRVGGGTPAKKAREEALADIKNNDLSEALLACDKSISLDGSYSPAYADRAGVRLAFGHPDKAITDCNLAIKFNPENGLAYAYRGMSYCKQGEMVHAVEDLTRALQLRSISADVYHSRAMALTKLGKFELALNDYSDAIRLLPSDAALFRERAAACDSLSKNDKEHANKLSQKQNELAHTEREHNEHNEHSDRVVQKPKQK